MKVVVVGPSKGTPSPIADIVLKQDGWDDFGFKTQYHIYYFAGDQGVFVGTVKILQLEAVMDLRVGNDQVAGHECPQALSVRCFR